MCFNFTHNVMYKTPLQLGEVPSTCLLHRRYVPPSRCRDSRASLNVLFRRAKLAGAAAKGRSFLSPVILLKQQARAASGSDSQRAHVSPQTPHTPQRSPTAAAHKRTRGSPPPCHVRLDLITASAGSASGSGSRGNDPGSHDTDTGTKLTRGRRHHDSEGHS